MKTEEFINRFEEPVSVTALRLDDGKHVKLSFSNIDDEPIFNYSTHKGKEKLTEYLSKSFLQNDVEEIKNLLS